MGTPLVEIPRDFPGVAWEHDPQADREALESQLPACHSFTPLAGIDSTDPTRENRDSLFLDISRTCSVLGGVDRVVTDIHDHFTQLGFRTHVRVGQTLGQAWALAHAPRPAVTDPAQELNALPLTSLQIDTTTISLLQELGIETLGQVLQLPRASLPSRFGPLLNQRVLQLLGHQPETIQVYHAENPWSWNHRLEHASGDLSILQTILCLLLRQAVQALKPRQLGILSAICRFRSSQHCLEYPLQLVEPTWDIDYLLQLWDLQMDRTSLPAPLDRVELVVRIAADYRPRQQRLFADPDQEQRTQRTSLVERLSARLGETAVQQLRRQSQALPERTLVARKRMTLQRSHTQRSSRRSSRQEQGPMSESSASPLPGSLERPARLYAIPRKLDLPSRERFYLGTPLPASRHAHPTTPTGAWVPLQFQFVRRLHTVVHAVGPERIESQWWEGLWVRRDYFRVQTQTGHRFWIFRNARDRHWYVHGDFA